MTDITLATIDGQPLTVGMARNALASAEQTAIDAKTAFNAKFSSFDADMVLAEDIAGTVAALQIPVISQDAAYAKLGFQIAQFMLDHPADASTVVHAEGPANVSLGD